MGAVFSQSEGNVGDIEGGPTNVGHMRLSLLPFAPPPHVAQLAYALLGLGYLTLFLALSTMLHLPAAGPVFGRYAAAYYAILVIIIVIFVPLELGTALALCLTRHSSEGRLPAFAKGLLLCAHVLFLVVIAMNGNCYFWKRGHHFHVVNIDVLPKQHSTCQVGFLQYGFSHTVVQILHLLDVLTNEVLHQELKEYPSWPTFRQHCIDGNDRRISS